jgi:hypothetical protein
MIMMNGKQSERDQLWVADYGKEGDSKHYILTPKKMED